MFVCVCAWCARMHVCMYVCILVIKFTSTLISLLHTFVMFPMNCTFNSIVGKYLESLSMFPKSHSLMVYLFVLQTYLCVILFVCVMIKFASILAFFFLSMIFAMNYLRNTTGCKYPRGCSKHLLVFLIMHAISLFVLCLCMCVCVCVCSCVCFLCLSQR